MDTYLSWAAVFATSVELHRNVNTQHWSRHFLTQTLQTWGKRTLKEFHLQMLMRVLKVGHSTRCVPKKLTISSTIRSCWLGWASSAKNWSMVHIAVRSPGIAQLSSVVEQFWAARKQQLTQLQLWLVTRFFLVVWFIIAKTFAKDILATILPPETYPGTSVLPHLSYHVMSPDIAYFPVQ